jgi:hypothetical protein
MSTSSYCVPRITARGNFVQNKYFMADPSGRAV